MYTLIDGVAFHKIVFDNISSPDTEGSTTFAMNAVANGDDNIETIKRHRLLYAINV
jgi:hypothetical protein